MNRKAGLSGSMKNEVLPPIVHNRRPPSPNRRGFCFLLLLTGGDRIVTDNKFESTRAPGTLSNHERTIWETVIDSIAPPASLRCSGGRSGWTRVTRGPGGSRIEARLGAKGVPRPCQRLIGSSGVIERSEVLFGGCANLTKSPTRTSLRVMAKMAAHRPIG